MIQLYNDPTLLDCVQACVNMPQDERDHVTEITGHDFTIDGAAMGAFTASGHKWVMKDEADMTYPLMLGGFMEERPGVYRDWLITSPRVWEQCNWFRATRICRRLMDALFVSGQAHRIECITPLARARVFPWYKILGYTQECVMQGYTASGYPAVLFSRVNN